MKETPNERTANDCESAAREEPDFRAAAFSEAHRLLLLQLTARRSISERRRREETQDSPNDGQQGADASEAATQHLPEQWRLVPEGFEPHEWQREALQRWMATGKGTVKVATGGGKTLFALYAAQILQNERVRDLRIAIVVPTIPLMFQWRDELARGNLPPSAIALMGGSQEQVIGPDVRVLVCVLNSARERLADFVRNAAWSDRMLLVVDECHRTAAEQARRIFQSHPAYALGLSATPESEADAGQLPSDAAYGQSVVGQALGPIIFEFTLAQSLAAGLLTPFEVWHIGVPLSREEEAEHDQLSRQITELRRDLQARYGRSKSKQGFLAWCQNQASRGGVDAERFIGLANLRKRLLYRAAARAQLTLSILTEAAADTRSRVIVFHESIEEVERLFLLTLDRGVPGVLEHSQLPDSLRSESIEAFRSGLARVIVSAKSLVEGFNVPSADLGVIVASSGSVRQRIQSLGRMLRRKEKGRTARVVVMYVRGTEDEAIYEKADWENVIGAERNRYFEWDPPTAGEEWTVGLNETGTPARTYRPTSWEVSVTALLPLDPYPAQVHGLDVRVDQNGNLRGPDDALIHAARSIIDLLVAHNRFRRGRITPAGHLITRLDAGEGPDADWRFLGLIETAEETTQPASRDVIRLKLKTASGRRVIARVGRGGSMAFALGPGSSRTPEGGEAREVLLAWIREQEARLGQQIFDLYWDGYTSYWLEVGGARIPFDRPLAPLEFQE